MKNLILLSNDPQRIDTIKSYITKANLECSYISGAYPKQNEVIMNCKVIKKGNAGLMLAHIEALKYVSNSNDTYNIFEDDEIIPKNYISLRENILSEITDVYDFVNLNPLRPKGSHYSDHFYKVSANISNIYERKCCNVWLSNYIATPSFAKLLLDLIITNSKFCKSFNSLIADWLISKILHKQSDTHNIYVLKNSNLISTHNETNSIRSKNNL